MEMKIDALAGTLESSDALVELSPGDGLNHLEIESVVYEQFGESLKRTAEDLLKQFRVTNAHMVLKDRGALDCVIRARVETAIKRAAVEED